MAKRHRPRRANLIALSPLSPQQLSSPTSKSPGDTAPATPSPRTPATPSPRTPAPSETPTPDTIPRTEQPDKTAPSTPPPPSGTRTTLPFTTQRPSSIPSARRKGPRNKAWTHESLRTALRVNTTTFSALLERIEPVFTADPTDPSVIAVLRTLEFTPAIVSAITLAWNGSIEDEPAFYLYHVAMAAKKRVKARCKGKERKTLGTQLIEMRDNIAAVHEATQAQIDEIRSEVEGVMVEMDGVQAVVEEVELAVEAHRVEVEAKVQELKGEVHELKVQFDAKVDDLKAVIGEKADALSASVAAQLSDFLITIGSVVVKK